MGKPEHPETYVRLVDPGAGPGEIEIYLARDIWEELAPDAEMLLFAVQGYGRFWIRFPERAAHEP